MNRVEVSPAAARPAGVVTRCEVQVEPQELLAPLPPLDAPGPVTLIVDEAGRVTWAGGAGDALLGEPGGDLVGRRVADLELGGSTLEPALRAVLEGAGPVERVGPGGLAVRVEQAAAGGAVVTLDAPAARARAAARRRALEAVERLGAAQSVEEVARGLVEALVPALADVAVVRVAERDGSVTVRKHRAPEREALVEALEGLLHVGPHAGVRDGGAAALRLERPVLLGDLSAEAVAGATGLDRAAQLVAALELRSAVVVPARLRGGVALIALASAGERALDQDDLRLAEALARRAAPALDRAWLERRLRAAVHTRERMLSSIGHDLRNPAAAISMAAEIMISRLPPGDSGSSLKMIRRAANQINALIQKILDESAADAADVD